MNYITEIKAFYDLLETNPLPSSAIAVWHALMHIANKTDWQQEFAVAVSVLEVKTGLNAKAIERARNKLAQAGLITWKKRIGNQSAVYTMISLDRAKILTNCENVAQSVVQSVAQSVLQSVAQPVAQSVGINKTKRNETNYSLIAEMYNEICSSFPKLTALSDARKKAIQARMNSGRSEEDFRRLFEKAQASSFLRGKNNRNWKATFDWLIKDANMAKVLDGNYDDGDLPEKQRGSAQKSSYNIDELEEYLRNSSPKGGGTC